MNEAESKHPLAGLNSRVRIITHETFFFQMWDEELSKPYPNFITLSGLLHAGLKIAYQPSNSMIGFYLEIAEGYRYPTHALPSEIESSLSRRAFAELCHSFFKDAKERSDSSLNAILYDFALLKKLVWFFRVADNRSVRSPDRFINFWCNSSEKHQQSAEEFILLLARRCVFVPCGTPALQETLLELQPRFVEILCSMNKHSVLLESQNRLHMSALETFKRLSMSGYLYIDGEQR